MYICMSKSLYEKINLFIFFQYESEHVMFFDKLIIFALLLSISEEVKSLFNKGYNI